MDLSLPGSSCNSQKWLLPLSNASTLGVLKYSCQNRGHVFTTAIVLDKFGRMQLKVFF